MIISVNAIKFACSILASLLAVFGGYVPYLRDIFLRKTKPHSYTWLIWAITQSVALAGLIAGRGGWGILPIAVGLFFVGLIFLISLKYGTENINRFDTAILVAALLSIVIWVFMHSPVLAVLMVSAIYFLGYLPSFRKTFQQPYTETLSSWIVFLAGNILIIFSLNEYNFLTLVYIFIITTANFIIVMICVTRRRVPGIINLE